MKCPKCEEGKLCKIKFKTSGKIAYLCDVCENYWYDGEHVDVLTGHILESQSKEFTVPNSYEFVQEADEQYQEEADEQERVSYELLG